MADNMVDLARQVKSGKLKLEDVRGGIREQVRRLLPVIGEKPQPWKNTVLMRGSVDRRMRVS